MRILFLLFPLLVFSIGIKESLYQTALRYIQTGNYIGALEILHFLGGYKDSQKLYGEVARFFRPPKVERLKGEPLIRVKIAQDFENLSLDCESKRLPLKVPYEIKLPRGCAVRFDHKAVKLPQDTFVKVLRWKGKTLAVAILPLETYLRGVLVGEVYLRWPLEVLKAQAVASRTYALFNLYKARKKGLPYDVDATTNYQVFKTFAIDHPKVVRAVAETRGEVLTYKGGLIYAMFHSNSGGCTANFEEITGLKIPYLTSVRENCNMATLKWSYWNKNLSKERVKNFLKEVLGLNVSRVEDIEIKRGTCGRGLLITLKTDGGSVTLPLSIYFRLEMRIPSDWFFVIGKSGSSFVLAGKGFGHGLGMSQWGAFCLANRGWDYKKILKFYYKGANIKRIY